MLGLSMGNVSWLLANKPIHIRREVHGPGVPEGLDIVVIFGQTEDSIRKNLESLGVIGPDTEIHEQPNL